MTLANTDQRLRRIQLEQQSRANLLRRDIAALQLPAQVTDDDTTSTTPIDDPPIIQLVTNTDFGHSVKSWNENLIGSAPSLSGAGGGGTSRSIFITSADFTAGSDTGTDYAYIFNGAHVATMPTAAGNGNLYTLKNGYSADVTVNAASGEKIDGVASYTLIPDESIDLLSDGTNWRIV